MRRFVPALAIAALMAPLLALPSRRAAAEEEKAEWAILVYHDADCDLEAPMLGDLDEMLAVGDTKEVRVVAFVDRSPKEKPEGRYSNRAVGGLEDWSGGKYVEVQKGKLREVGPTPDEPNMGDPATLVAFVERAMKDFPAKRYALVLGDHGLAWPGVCADESHDDDFLTPAELHVALEKITKEHGKLDLVGFDACLMANVETAQAMAPFAKIMVASEELEPGSGWWYTPFLAALEKAPTTEAAALGASIADEFLASFSKQKGVAEPGAGRDVTLSVVDLSKAEAVATATAALGDAATKALAAKGRDAYLAIAKSRAAAEQYGRSADPKKSGSQMYDLLDFAARLAVDYPALAPLATRVEEAVRAAVLHTVRGDTRPDSNGLSVYLPRDAAGVGGLYDTTPLGAQGAWGKFLGAYAAAAEKDSEKPAAGEASGSGEALEEGKPLTITATATSVDDLEKVSFVLASAHEGGVVVVGSMPETIPADGKLSHAWGGGWFTLEDGKQKIICPITSIDEVDEAKRTFLADVPAQVHSKEGAGWEDVTLTFFIDEDSDGSLKGEFLNATKFDESGPSEIPLEPGDQVRAVYVRIDAAGDASSVVVEGEGTTLTVDDEANLKVGFDKVPAGDWLVGFWLEDYSGNSSLALAPVKTK